MNSQRALLEFKMNSQPKKKTSGQKFKTKPEKKFKMISEIGCFQMNSQKVLHMNSLAGRFYQGVKMIPQKESILFHIQKELLKGIKNR